MEWDLTNDKARIGEVLELARTDLPQTIVDGDWRYTLTPIVDNAPAKLEPPKTLKDWLLNGPSLEGVDLDRDRSPDREIDL